MSHFKKSSKYYIRPFGFVSENEGKKLEKFGKSLKIGSTSRYFTRIELIKNSGKVSSDFFDIDEFYDFVKINNIVKLKTSLDNIISPRKLLEKKKYFEKNKKFFIFGILNITPDSFSDGGDFTDVNKATEEAIKMVNIGADYVDIGGESTRPGAKKVRVSDEILRVMPIIQKLKQKKIRISLDTRNSETMKFGILSGVSIINDVSGLDSDKNSLQVIKESNVPVIIMHMPGNPSNMMKKNIYDNLILDLVDFFHKKIDFCTKHGLNKNNIIIDPGIGFGKDTNQNLEILKNISIFHSLGCPIMLGASRKRFISSILEEKDPKKRLPGSLSAVIHSLHQGVQIMRVHDVKETFQAIEVWNHIESAK